MKRFLFLLLFPLALHAQKGIVVAPGEYDCFFLMNGVAYDASSTNVIKITGQPSGVAQIAAALHTFLLTDKSGNLYSWGDNNYGTTGNGTVGGYVSTPTMIATDSAGHAFTGIVQVESFWGPGGEYDLALKGDGTVWTWGATAGGGRGNGTAGGTNTRPVQVVFPAGVVVKSIKAGNSNYAIDQNGALYSWGGGTSDRVAYFCGQGTSAPNYTIPTRVPLPSAVAQVGTGSYSTLVRLANGQLYGWGYYGNSAGFGATAPGTYTPTLITAFNQPAIDIGVNTVASYVILADHTLWAWGDNANGTIGNGQELNFATYKTPYGWDWGPNELMVSTPVQVQAGTYWSKIWVGNGAVFYAYAQDSSGQLYSWGRNKGGVLGNGLIGATSDIVGQYPNSWDVTKPTAVSPLSFPPTVLATSPYCILNPSALYCNETSVTTTSLPVVTTPPPPPPNIPPVAVLSAPASATLPADTLQLDASGSTDPDGLIATYNIAQISGPPSVLVQSGAKATVYATASGTYTFRLTVVDNSGASTSTTQAVTVNPYPACPVCPVCPAPRNVTSVTVNAFGQLITIPASVIVSATYQ